MKKYFPEAHSVKLGILLELGLFLSNFCFINIEEKETTEDEIVEWHHWLDGHEFE